MIESKKFQTNVTSVSAGTKTTLTSGKGTCTIEKTEKGFVLSGKVDFTRCDNRVENLSATSDKLEWRPEFEGSATAKRFVHEIGPIAPTCFKTKAEAKLRALQYLYVCKPHCTWVQLFTAPTNKSAEAHRDRELFLAGTTKHVEANPAIADEFKLALAQLRAHLKSPAEAKLSTKQKILLKQAYSAIVLGIVPVVAQLPASAEIVPEVPAIPESPAEANEAPEIEAAA